MPGKRWTEDELEYLEEKVGKIKLSAIAKTLDRSLNAVELKAKRLGLSGTKYESGKLTANELAQALNVDLKVVTRWVAKKGLKAAKRATREKAKFILIDVQNFWKWAKDNKDKINFSKIEPYQLLPEPDWVEEERKKDYHAIPKRTAQKWTDEEDKQMILMIKGGYTQQQIGEALKRSDVSVQRRLSRLKEWGRVPKAKITLRWSEKELQMFYELDAKGLSDEQIACEMGRETGHITDKRRRLRNEGKYQGFKGRAS